MSRLVYRYDFTETVDWDDIQTTLTLALLATEALHGEATVQLDAAHYLDSAKRACVIHAGTSVGRDFNRLFTGFMGREFGADAFTVERVEEHDHQPEVVA